MNIDSLAAQLKQKKVPVILLAVVIIASGAFYFYTSSKKVDAGIILYGNVDLRQVTLAFNGSDRIRDLYVEEGDQVKPGQVLGILDVRELQLSIDKIKAQIEAQESALLKLQNGSRPEELAQLQARLAAADANAEYARLQAERTNSAFATSAGRSVSVQDRDAASAEYRTAGANAEEAREAYKLAVEGPRAEDIAEAAAQLKALRADLALKEFSLSQAQLIAPVAGVIRSRLAEPGDMATPQKPVLLLAVEQTKWVRAYLAEPQLGKVKPGMAAEVVIDSFPNSPLKGQVGFISSVAEFTPKTVQTEDLRTSLLYEVRIQVKDTDNILRMGMPATVRIGAAGTGGQK